MNEIQQVKQRFGIIGNSEKLYNALDTAIRVAPTNLSVLIQGESGVGKESFSQIIHSLSSRKHETFIAINCGAIPPGTINSELFGHTKGSFTGATGERKGYFETADGGTIFLDEIGEMPMDTQAYLLRVLENGEFMKVGSSDIQKTDVRVIAATNVDLIEKVQQGKFREDLYYRLNTVPIYVPPLRERKEDIYMLFRKFSLDFAEDMGIQVIQLDEQARSLIENYAWPGNIRELKNVVQQLSILAERRMIDADDLLTLIPNIRHRNLPMKVDGTNDQMYQEREILYKLLFDMKSDLNDLKSLVYGLIDDNNLRIPTTGNLNQIDTQKFENLETDWKALKEVAPIAIDSDEPVFYQSPRNDTQVQDQFYQAEILDDTLSLEDMEKRMIKKALKKYKGRRKDAAEELGISERTLYRKINQYNIDL